MDLPPAIERLLAALRSAPQVEAVLEVGSRDPACRDAHSDHDLLVVTVTPLPGATLRAMALAAGLHDDDAASRHCPLDQGGFLTADDECLEVTCRTLASLHADLDRLLVGAVLDEGLAHQLVHAGHRFDRSGSGRDLVERVASPPFPRALLPRLLATKPGTALKLLRTAVHRGDVPRAAFWLARLFEDSVRVLFAANERWYPGPKRMLLGAIAPLAWCPPSFVPWWSEVLAQRGAPWPVVLEGAERVTAELLAGPEGGGLTPPQRMTRT